MIYLLFGCFLVFFIADWIHLHRVDKHDGVLFPFCQLRRDVMRFLYEKMIEEPRVLSHEEYIATRRLLDVLNDTIHNYNRHKTILFNLRKVVKLIRQYRHVVKQVEPINATGNKEIQVFHARFAVCLAKAFIAYTPLIRSEFVLRLVAFVYRVAIHESARRIAKDMKYMLTVTQEIREDAHSVNITASAAV